MEPRQRPASYAKKAGLVLQGGGALGSYQAGVYEALASSEYLPDWVAGISIGSINAAIIAGNPPEHRLQRLQNFWDDITATTKMWPAVPPGPLAEWQNRASALTTVMFGQPGFFTPRPLQDWFSPGSFVSYYTTSVLKQTLERRISLTDPDSLDWRHCRVSTRATKRRLGQRGLQIRVPWQGRLRAVLACPIVLGSPRLNCRCESGKYRRAAPLMATMAGVRVRSRRRPTISTGFPFDAMRPSKLAELPK
jgi:Patatin-like phospholipase